MPTSQARLLLQKSATETGLDERTAISLARPAHYPDMLWHSSGRYLTEEEEAAFRQQIEEQQDRKKAPATTAVVPLQFTKRSTAMAFLVRKQRHLLANFQSSPQHVQHVPPHMDITRYHDLANNCKRPADHPDRVVLQALGKKLGSTDHLPQELLGSTVDRKRKSRKRRRNADGTLVDLDEFEKRERGSTQGNSDDDDDDSEDEDIFDLTANANDDEDEDEDDNADYTTNYYESEESDGGVDDGEPTF